MCECTRSAGGCLLTLLSLALLLSSSPLSSPRRPSITQPIIQPPILSSEPSSDASFEAPHARCGRRFGKCTTSTSLLPKNSFFLFPQHHHFFLLQQHHNPCQVSHTFLHRCSSLRLLLVFIPTQYILSYNQTLIFPTHRSAQNGFSGKFFKPFSSLLRQWQERQSSPSHCFSSPAHPPSFHTVLLAFLASLDSGGWRCFSSSLHLLGTLIRFDVVISTTLHLP